MTASATNAKQPIMLRLLGYVGEVSEVYGKEVYDMRGALSYGWGEYPKFNARSYTTYEASLSYGWGECPKCNARSYTTYEASL